MLAVMVEFNKISTTMRLNEGPGLALRGFLVSPATQYLVSLSSGRGKCIGPLAHIAVIVRETLRS